MKSSRLRLETIKCRYTQYSTATLQKFFARINQFYDPFGRSFIATHTHTHIACVCANANFAESKNESKSKSESEHKRTECKMDEMENTNKKSIWRFFVSVKNKTNKMSTQLTTNTRI